MEAGLERQLREQASQSSSGDREELAVGGDPHHRLRDAEGGDLRIGQASAGVLPPLGQEIVCGAEHRSEQQVEVGEHRGPLGSKVRLDTADFDLLPPASSCRPTSRPAAWNQSSSRACT
jgi:hypothetical protein